MIAIEPHRQPPPPSTLEEAGDLQIKDTKGATLPFKSLYTSQSPSSRQLIIFIRHFLCGVCEEYVRKLGADLPPSKLAESNTTLTIIGCGDPVCIPDYVARTSCPYEIYADPSQALYKKLSMVSNLRGPVGGKRPEYMSKGYLSTTLNSIRIGIMSGTKAFKAGPASQNGGEWLFQDGELKWVHRMQNTSDHAEVKELKEALGIE